jgi:hypothetical protein
MIGEILTKFGKNRALMNEWFLRRKNRVGSGGRGESEINPNPVGSYSKYTSR